MTIRKLFFALALPLVVMSCGGGVKHISDMETSNNSNLFSCIDSIVLSQRLNCISYLQ